MKRFVKSVGLVVAMGCSTMALAQAAEDYLDDRSTPETLVQSYYNAINQGQYTRAYGYFSEGFAPKDYRNWTTGYADTRSVTVKFGGTQPDPGAGQIYWALPVAISVVAANGGTQIYAGCYTIHLTNPEMQTQRPFQPMSISGAKLKKTTADIQNAIPQNCEPDR